MVKTPQDFFGPAIEDEYIRLDDQYGVLPDVKGSIAYSDGYFYLKDAYGSFNARVGGSGLNENQHKTLRQLIHFIDDGPAEGFSGAYKETLPVGNPFPTQEIWWTSTEKTTKVIEVNVAYNINKTISQEQWKMYDISGNLLTTITDTISYSSVFEISRIRVVT